MFKKIFLIIIALAVVALIFVIGYCVAIKNLKPVESSMISNLEKSPLVQNWMATLYGKVTAISGNTLTLTFQEKSIAVPIKEDAKIESVTFIEAPKEGAALKPELKTIQFSDIKIGDNASVFVEIKQNGDLLGANISIIIGAPAAK
jgi:hypothetical protein